MLRFHRPAAAILVSTVLWPTLAFAQASKAGVVTTLEGNVTVTRVALAPQPLKFKDDVFVNDKVITGDKSIARMLLDGKAVVTVREHSSLTITQQAGKATIDLQAGKIALAVAKEKMRPGESIEIRAANAVAGVRGTVVVAEVASATAQLGPLVNPVGTFWVIKGQIDALLSNVPGSRPVPVNAGQQFLGGNVINFPASQLSQIVQGLSLGKLPKTQGGDDQAKENAVNSGISSAGAFTGVGAGGGGSVTPPTITTVSNSTTPILPGNKPLTPPPATPAPVTQPPSCGGYGYGHGGH